MTPPPVSETAATTAEREARAVEAGQKLLDANAMLRSEIHRVRAEKEEQALQVQGLSEELERVREERERIRSAAASREGHSVEAKSRRYANLRRNVRQLQRAYEASVHEAHVWRQANERQRELLDELTKERDDWMSIARESKRLDGWGLWLMLFGAFALGIFVTGLSDVR